MLKTALFLIAKLEASQMSLKRGMDEQTAVKIYNGILLSNKYE